MNVFRRQLLTASLGLPLAGLASLAACTRAEPQVRVAGIVWVGYEPLFLARELGYFNESRLRLVELPSNTASLMALASGEVEAATLTLDECLIAREGNLDLRAILVFDDSAGADVIMGRPDIKELRQVRGKRIGVEETAAGALMLYKLLEAAGLGPKDVIKVPFTGDSQVTLYRSQQIDVVVSFEPYTTQLAKLGARRLLDSSRFPGLIVDVLVARADALEASPEQFRQLTAGYFRALDFLQKSPAQAAPLMAPRQGISADEVLQALRGVRMMDLPANRNWLTGTAPQLQPTARTVADIMLQSGLLHAAPNLENLVDARFLPTSGAGAS